MAHPFEALTRPPYLASILGLFAGIFVAPGGKIRDPDVL